jgi:hypothetical protein
VFAYIIGVLGFLTGVSASYYSEIERIFAKKCKGKRWIWAKIDRTFERVFADLPTI